MSWQQDWFEDTDESWEGALSARERMRLNRRPPENGRGRRSAPNRREIIASLAEENDQAIDFNPTYTRNLDPKHHERRWVLDALSGFYHDRVIDDVLHIVKGGKEANVYCCTATEHVGVPLIAAKIYRPRMLRHLKNDALYKEGRFTRDHTGKELRGTRETRALQKKTRFGQDLDFSSWIVHEFRVHQELFAAGVDVPRPIAHRGNTILMRYLGQPHNPARTLSDTTITAAEARPLFDRILENVELMLARNAIHGDLSAYNILYWEGEIALIDFPQVVDPRVNPNAFPLLERDIVRVCEYFDRYGIEADGGEIAAQLYQRYRDGLLK